MLTGDGLTVKLIASPWTGNAVAVFSAGEVGSTSKLVGLTSLSVREKRIAKMIAPRTMTVAAEIAQSRFTTGLLLGPA
jgi:hypothetical protein